MQPRSRLALHDLTIRQEGEEWIVGRQETGEFVGMPAQAVSFLRALQDEHSIAGAEDLILRGHGVRVDGLDFVGTLVELGFVASVDGEPCGPALTAPSLPWLRPCHVRWMFGWPARLCIAAYILGSLTFAAAAGGFPPGYDAYFVTSWQGFNIAWTTAMVVAAASLHEFAHLAAARSERVYAKVGIGTRLVFLCAQTTVTGLWGAERGARFRVFLAGIAMDLTLISSCALAINIGRLGGFESRSLQALILGLILSVAGEFELFMRTDIYFVLQELLRCKNLHSDARAYLRYLSQGLHRVLGDRRPRMVDPTSSVPAAERRPVRIYSAVMLLGTMAALSVFAYYTIPIMVTLFYRSFGEIIDGVRTADVLRTADGLMAVVVEGGLQVLFIRTFLGQHGRRLTAVRTAMSELPARLVRWYG